MGTTAKPMRQEKQPASEEVTEVAPDILRMQLPISMPGLGHVNTYALCDDRGVALVDPGLPGRASHKALVDRLSQAGYGVKDVHTVVVTHSHPDHFGGAGLLRDESGAEVVTHRFFRTWLDPDEGDDAGPDEVSDESGETDRADASDRSSAGRGSGSAPWQMKQPWGGGSYKMPLRRRFKYTVGRRMARRWMRAPDPTKRIDDADVLTLGGREWVALHTPGHTSDHLCLFSPADGTVLSGDHVLPTITPHISGLAAGHDPLDEFFASLDRMTELRDVTLALPAHGHPFEDLAGRAKAIRKHHEERLDKLRDAAGALGESSVVALSHELFQRRSWGSMAESETYAHLEHLRHAGEMTSRYIDDQLHFELVPRD